MSDPKKSLLRYARLPHHYGYSRKYMRGGKVTYSLALVGKVVGEDEDDLLNKEFVMCVLSNDLIMSIK